MSTHRFIQLAAVCVVCAGAYLVFRSAEPADASQEPEVVPADAKQEPPKKAVELQGEAAERKPDPKPVAQSNRIKLPDGTTVPVLNGAFGAPDMGWPDDRPWSPIIGKETDDQGDEWYVHEDGSRSITKNVFHSHIGGMAPVTSVYNPTKPLPMDPNEMKLVKERMAREARKKEKAAKKGDGPKK